MNTQNYSSTKWIKCIHMHDCITGQLVFWQLTTHLHFIHARDLVHKAETFIAEGYLPGKSAVQSFSQIRYISNPRHELVPLHSQLQAIET
ncbi:hypothetical protein ACB092_05G150800 [Castanea dentata]